MTFSSIESNSPVAGLLEVMKSIPSGGARNFAFTALAEGDVAGELELLHPKTNKLSRAKKMYVLFIKILNFFYPNRTLQAMPLLNSKPELPCVTLFHSC